MNRNKPEQEKQKQPEVGEDSTQYGEFVSTYFAWIPLPEQKEKAEKMVQMTNRKKGDGDEISQGKKSDGDEISRGGIA